MRRVFLATTALVALGGVSAASADVTLSASASWAYDSWSDDTKAVTSAAGNTTNNTAATMDSDFIISGSTTVDSGMTFGGSIHIDDGVDDGAKMHISDDWGQISFGEHNDAAKSASAGNSAFETAISGNSSLTLTPGLSETTIVGSKAKGQIMYTSPTVSGLTLRLSQSDAGSASKNDATAIGATYSIGFDGVDISAHYAMYDVDSAGDVATGVGSYKTDQDGFGVKISYGDFTIRAASMDKNSKQGGDTIGDDGYEASTSDYGITYAISDTITLEAIAMSSELSSNSADEADTYEATQVGVKYVPATGIYISLTNRSYELKDVDTNIATKNDGTNTRLKVGVTF